MSDERSNSINTSGYGINPYLSNYDTNKIKVKFIGGCLKQDRATLLHGGIVNIYTVYKITDNFNVSSYPTLENCLFGGAKLTKNAELASTDILVMELDLIDKEVFHLLVLD